MKNFLCYIVFMASFMSSVSFAGSVGGGGGGGAIVKLADIEFMSVMSDVSMNPDSLYSINGSGPMKLQALMLQERRLTFGNEIGDTVDIVPESLELDEPQIEILGAEKPAVIKASN